MELAYTWPSFNNGFSLDDEFTPAQRQLSEQMVRWWGGFARFGAPLAPGQPHWPSYQRGAIMSLRPGDASVAIPASEFAADAGGRRRQRRPQGIVPDIAREDVATAAGTTSQALADAADRGGAVEAMGDGGDGAATV
jgi:hypothetical protein